MIELNDFFIKWKREKRRLYKINFEDKYRILMFKFYYIAPYKVTLFTQYYWQVSFLIFYTLCSLLDYTLPWLLNLNIKRKRRGIIIDLSIFLIKIKTCRRFFLTCWLTRRLPPGPPPEASPGHEWKWSQNRRSDRTCRVRTSYTSWIIYTGVLKRSRKKHAIMLRIYVVWTATIL